MDFNHYTNQIVGQEQYKTLWVPAGAMIPNATAGAVAGTNEYLGNDINIDYFAFAKASETYVEFDVVMDESWDLGTVKTKFYWTSDTGSTLADTVEWEIAGGEISDDNSIDAALGTSQVISDALLASSGTKLQISDATPALTIGGTPALGDFIHFKISRNIGGTDDMAENAWLFGCWIQFKTILVPVAW